MRPRIKYVLDQAFEPSKKYSITGGLGALDTIIAAETIQVFANTVIPIKINEIEIPRNHTIQPCAYNRHPLGSVISVAEEIPKSVTEERKVEFVMFISWENGTVEKDDVLGVIDTIPIEIKESED
ncbi:MAG: DUF22 domain-containing protein [Halobacteriota archaeon]|nr:DUF22 domain-containing protein [Halobacteriota archaeon]